MGFGRGATSFLGIGEDAPAPSGDPDPVLAAGMQRQARAWWFRLRVNVWARLIRRRRFDWDGYYQRLADAEYRKFKKRRDAAQSFGYMGRKPDGGWLFGAWGYRIPLLGKSIMRHELFHAAQDHLLDIHDPKPGFWRSMAIEFSAHLWGGPLVGIPFAWGGAAVVLGGLAWLGYLVLMLFVGLFV